MATSIPIRVELQNQLAVRQTRQFERALRGVEQQTRRTNRRFAGLTRQLETFRRITATGIGLVVARQINAFAFSAADAADSLALLEARLQALGGTAQTFQQTVDVANRLGVSFDTAGQSVARFLIAADEIGITARQATQLSETVLQLGRVAGLTQIELTQSTRQLAQGLSSGRLAGDELRSVLEGLPPVAIAIADTLGVSIGQLRELGAQGKITGEVIVTALESVQAQAEEQFAQLPVTAERAFQELANQWTELLRVLNVNTVIVGIIQLIETALEGITDLVDGVKVSVSEATTNIRLLEQELEAVNRAAQAGALSPIVAEQRRGTIQESLGPLRAEQQRLLNERRAAENREVAASLRRQRRAQEDAQEEAIKAEKELDKIRLELAKQSQDNRLALLKGAARQITELEIELQETLSEIRRAGFNPQEEIALRERAIRDSNARIEQIQLEDAQRIAENNQRLAEQANERARRNREELNRELLRLDEERNEAERQLAEEQAQFLEATLGTAFRGLFDALEEGENAWEAFADTAIDAIKRIAQEILISGIINLLTGQPFLGGNSPLSGIFGQGAAPLAATAGAPAAFAATATTGSGTGRFPSRFSGSGQGNLAVTIRNEGTPQRIAQVNQSAGSDPRQLVVNVITEDIGRRGPIARSLEGNFGLSRG